MAVSLEPHQLPPFSTHAGYKAHSIADYLEALVSDRCGMPDGCVFLPSPTRLARFFDCTFYEVNKACDLLRRKGHDCRCLSLESPITLIRTDAPATPQRHPALATS